VSLAQGQDFLRRPGRTFDSAAEAAAQRFLTLRPPCSLQRVLKNDPGFRDTEKAP
jgi:hypothetical protein